MVRTGYLAICAFLFWSCERKENASMDYPPPLYGEPRKIMYNASGGYHVNQLTGDSIPVIVNRRGDTIQTGKEYTIKGLVLRPDTLGFKWESFGNQKYPLNPGMKKPPRDKYGFVIPPEIAKKPVTVPLQKRNEKILLPAQGQMKEVNTWLIDENKLEKFVIGNDKTDSFIIKSTRETEIQTGTPIRLEGKIVSFSYPGKVSAGFPRFRDKSRYDVQYTSKEEGMISSGGYKMLLDRKGYVWIAHAKGISRYDGNHVLNFTFKMDLLEFDLISLLNDKHNNLWIGLRDRIYCYNGKHLVQYLNFVPTSNTCLSIDNRDNIWIGTAHGLIRLQPDSNLLSAVAMVFNKTQGLPETHILSISPDNDGSIWISTARHLFKLNQQSSPIGTITYFTGKESPIQGGSAVLAIDSSGNVWFAEYPDRTICQYVIPRHNEPGVLRQFAFGEKQENLPVTGLMMDRKGNLWIGTEYKGVIKCHIENITAQQGYQCHTFFSENGLMGNMCNPQMEDESGNIWVSTLADGIYRINPNSFYSPEENDFFKGVNFTYQDKEGYYWIGSVHNSFYKYKRFSSNQPGSITQFVLDKNLMDGYENLVLSSVMDSRGNIWFGTENNIVVYHPKKQLASYFNYENGARGIVFSMMEHLNRSMWFTSYGGILKYEYQDDPASGVFTHYTVYHSGLATNKCLEIMQDRQGTVYISTNQGVVVFRNISSNPEVRSTIITEREGLSNNSATGLLEDINGMIWIGTANGLNIFKPSSAGEQAYFIYFTEKEGLSSNNIQFIRQGPQTRDESNIWVKTNNGIEVFKVHKGKQVPTWIATIANPEGLNPDMINSLNFDRQGNQVNATLQGIRFLDRGHFLCSDKKPDVYLQAIDIDGNQMDYRNLRDSVRNIIRFDSIVRFENFPSNLSLPYNHNNLKFHFSAIDWSAPHKLKYAYKIQGLENKWSNASNESSAEYRNLSPGKYTFKVAAIGESQTWSEPVEYAFTIRPPWWYSWWAFSMYGVLGGLVLYRTHRFQLNRRLELAERKRLVELDRVKNQLYTNITHEFRTPLTLIHGPVSEALTKNLNLEQKDIQSIYRQSERLQQLINQMLDLQKLEAGMLKPHLTYGEITNVLRYVFNSFESWAKDKNIAMIFSGSVQELYMDFDKEKITQIISNLLSNAIKHTSRNGKIAMIVKISPRGDQLLIQVKDTGVGIDAEDIPYIFDRFYQSKRSSVGGTGIGLAIVKNLVDLLGGRVEVESRVDVGTTFNLMFPISKSTFKEIKEATVMYESMEADLQEEESNFAPQARTLTGKPLVLIVEDNVEVSQYLVSCLERDYEIMVAFNGNEGLTVAYANIPDIIISDVMMPGKDGFELCRQLKTDIQTSHIPIILLTGRGDHDGMISGIQHGADAYVVKPFNPSELELRVQKLLELRANLRQYYKEHSTAQSLTPVVAVSAKENEFLKKIREFVLEHISDSRFSIDMVCSYMAMSHPQIHRKVTALTGESVGKLVRSVRLAKAKELLRQSDLTISEIAYETGFSEPGYFSKVFSKEFAISPSEYRTNPTE